MRKPRVRKMPYPRLALWSYSSGTEYREFPSWGDAMRYATNPSRGGAR